MADPDMDEDIFADLYDGDDDDAAPPPAPAKEEPIQAFPDADDLIPQPLGEEQAVKSEAPSSGEANVKTEVDSAVEGMQGVQNAKQEDHGDDYDRPIGIKEDGYV